MTGPLLTAGEVLDGKWRIEGELGRGGMGSVYAALHVRNQRRVAIKVLHGELAHDPEQRERLHREGFASNRVDHPGVVAILDDGYTAGGASYLVMERLEGQPLDALADQQGGLLSLEQVLDLGARWLDVVAAAHAVGVVHRDLKPENVFLTSAGVLKVLDFGLASVRDEGAAPAHRDRSAHGHARLHAPGAGLGLVGSGGRAQRCLRRRGLALHPVDGASGP